jgi:hypothetical protein
MATGAVIARILTQYSDKGSKAAQKDIARLTKKFDDFGRKTRRSFALAITATAALSVKIGTEAVQAAIDDSKSQAQLALAMANTTGATKEAIAAAEDYIEKTMFRTNTADELLRASLAQLYIATGDLTEAQRLQSIGLDVAAATGKDLASVTTAITRAQQGNLTALKRLSPELSGLISNGMKAEDVFALLATTYGGTAEALADLDPLTNLKLQYGEVLETLGYELLPVVKDFAKILQSDVIPVVKEWIKANGDKLRTGLKDVAELSLKLLGVIGEIASFLQRNKFWIELAINFLLLGRAVKVVGKGMSVMDKIFGTVIGLFKNGRKEVGKLADKFEDFVKTTEAGYFGRFVELLGKAVSAVGKLITGFLGFGAATLAAKNILKSLLGIEEKTVKTTFDLTKQVYGGAAAEKYKAEVAAAAAKKTAAARAKAAAAAAKEAAEAAKDAALQAKIDANILKIRKQLNITKDSAIDKETDLVNLAAAAKLLEKQGVIAKEEMAKLERLKEENFLLEARETLAKRYADIQKVLADQKLDTKEIEELSKQWGISGSAVVAYIHLVKSVEDQVISTQEIQTLADLWNTSEAEAQKFLEVYMRIQDGLLSSSEVFDLVQQGFFKTEKEARIYADLVATVHDGLADDEAFFALSQKWGISKEQVNAYIRTMGADFDYEGTFLDPVTQLAIKWEFATAALKRYLDMLNSAKGFDYGKLNPPTTVIPPTVIPPKTDGLGGSKTDSAASKAAENAAASAAAAAAYAAAKAKGDMDAAAKAAAGVRPSDLASKESGAIGAASIAAQLKAAEQAQALQDNITAMSKFRAKEAQDAMNDAAASRTMDYDEKFRFRSMTMANASSINSGNLMAGGVTNVTVNVAGSVTTEEDLVQTVRNGLLNAQYNGNSITLQAI